MAKIYSLLLALFSFFTTSAQAPQGFNYQAVAYNASGVAVTNQSIGLKITILDGSATGTIVYEERQNPTTDNTGLFSIVIGNGTVLSGTFNTINWGNGAKWIKTEIDITGGTSYVVAGNAQFLSVPYALYSNQAQSAAGSFWEPDDFTHMTPLKLYDSIPYTVPAGKNLYISSDEIMIDSMQQFNTGIWSNGMSTKTLLAASPGSVVRSTGTGFLVDKIVDWKTVNVICTPLTIPANKIFVLISVTDNGNHILLNGSHVLVNGTLSGTVFDSGDVISATESCGGETLIMTGYFRNK